MPNPRRREPIKSFDDTLRDAINDLVKRGFVSGEQVQDWIEKLEMAAEAEMLSPQQTELNMKRAMERIFTRLVDHKEIQRTHPEVDLFTIDRLRPQMRSELDRRLAANRALIKLNRTEEREKMKRRFAGWASSVPKGGSKTIDKREAKEAIRKSLSGLSFRERRLMIDQGQKLEAALSEIVAVGGGAIAAVWKSHWKQANYDFREDHKHRATQSAKLPYVVRGNWALEAGLMKLANSTYTDELTKPGEEVYCRCWYEYIYSLRDLPSVMVTAKGRKMLDEVKKRMAS